MSASPARATPKLREASFEDYAQIALLQAEYGMGGGSYEEWQHLWADNPAYVGLHSEWPIGWVLQAGGDIVGYKGNIPVFYELNGKRLIAGCGYSWVVASPYRGYSILLLERYLRQKNAALCLSTTVGPAACNALATLGALPVPAGKWDRASVWITTYTSFVASWLARRKFPLARVASYPISAALFARDSVIKREIRRKKRVSSLNLKIHCCNGFDEGFDSFWEVIRTENPNTLLAVRSRAVLEWHFRYALREKRVWIATVNEGSCPCAYAIFLLERNSRDGMRRITFVDFQARAGKTALFYPMLTWALERCRREGIHLLQAVGLCPRVIGDISVLAPYQVEQDAWTYWYKSFDTSLATVLKDPGVWAPSLFDGDASI